MEDGIKYLKVKSKAELISLGIGIDAENTSGDAARRRKDNRKLSCVRGSGGCWCPVISEGDDIISVSFVAVNDNGTSTTHEGRMPYYNPEKDEIIFR
jgi:hypothetical protein